LLVRADVLEVVLEVVLVVVLEPDRAWASVTAATSW
jgi:hypothetical protein